jgi:hypothetical protein
MRKLLQAIMSAPFLLLLVGCGSTTSSPQAPSKKPDSATGAGTPAAATQAAPAKIDLLLGTWEVTKGPMPAGSKLEFGKDGKMTLLFPQTERVMKKSITKSGKITADKGLSPAETQQGTYELAEDGTLTVKREGGPTTTLKIVKLADTELILHNPEKEGDLELKKR